MSSGLIFLLIGPSGSGKTSIIAKVLEDFHDIKRFVTFTSRPARPGEKDGVDYFFVSSEHLSNMARSGKLIEWQEFYGQKYGSSSEQIRRFVYGQIDGIAAYDVLGATQLQELFPQNIITIFVIPPSLESIRERLLKRYGNEVEGHLRIDRFNMEMGYAGKFKYVVNNENLETAIQNVEGIVRAERCYRQARKIQHESQAGASQ